MDASNGVISIHLSTSIGTDVPTSGFFSACRGAWRGSPDDTLDAESRSEDQQRLHSQYGCSCGCVVRVPDFDGSSIASAKAYLERCYSGRQSALQTLRTAVGNAYTSSRDIRTGAALDPEADMRDYLLPLVSKYSLDDSDIMIKTARIRGVDMETLVMRCDEDPSYLDKIRKDWRSTKELDEKQQDIERQMSGLSEGSAHRLPGLQREWEGLERYIAPQKRFRRSIQAFAHAYSGVSMLPDRLAATAEVKAKEELRCAEEERRNKICDWVHSKRRPMPWTRGRQTSSGDSSTAKCMIWTVDDEDQ